MTVQRILGGRFRGRAVPSPVHDGTRPLLSRVRKALADTLAPDLPGAGVLDLFAGTGAVGLELMSRGGAAVTFVESSREASGAIEAAGRGFGLPAGECRAIPGDVLDPTAWDRPGLPGRPWRIVFVGTPYRMLEAEGADRIWRALATLGSRGGVTPDALVVIQCEATTVPAIPAGWRADGRGTRTYGRTALAFVRQGGQPA